MLNLFGNRPALATTPSVSRMAPAEAAVLVKNGAVVIDVREAQELRQTGTVPNARHVPLSKGLEFLETKLKALPADSTVLLVCRSGTRTFATLQQLTSLRHIRLADVEGGLMNWASHRLPLTAAKLAG